MQDNLPPHARSHRPLKPALTSLRFVAAMFVVFFHYSRPLTVLGASLGGFGYEAVTFFFVLSGFVLVYAHACDVGLNISVPRFYLLRVARIVPAYLLGLILCAPFYFRGNAHSAAGTIAVILMVQAWVPAFALLWNEPAWSLSNEAFFYFLFPRLSRSISGVRPWVAVTIAFCAVIIAGIARHFGGAPHDFNAYFPLLTLPQFALGVALGFLYLRQEQSSASRWRYVFYATIAATALVIYARPSLPWLGSPEFLSALFALLVYAAARAPADPIFSNSLFVLLGEASYSLYILHFPVWLLWNHATTVRHYLVISPSLDFLCVSTLAIGVSLISYLLVERPAWAQIVRYGNLFKRTAAASGAVH